MTADEINAGLAEYMGYRCEPTFTDSLDACDLVVEKLAYGKYEFSVGPSGEKCAALWVNRRWYRTQGLTRAYALAAALWAAVKETGDA